MTKLAIWVLALGGFLAFSAVTTLGPTVLTVTKNHGVHLADVVAFVVAVTAASILTVRESTRRQAAPRAGSPSRW